jgi:hypothetical protein
MQSKIQMGRHPLHHLDRLLLILSGILIFAASYIADFLKSLTEINSWVIGINIYRFTFLLLIFALRREFIFWLGKAGYRVVYYLLINHFVDIAIGCSGWSINDTLTVVILAIEAVVEYFGRERIISYLRRVFSPILIPLKKVSKRIIFYLMRVSTPVLIALKNLFI